jgi:hypothetical protein
VNLTFDSFAATWWPYLFILVAGALATDLWRWIGVFAGSALKEESEALIFVRASATALVAAVVGQLVTFPTGEIAALPISVRIAALAFGWLAFLIAGRRIIVGVAAAEAVLIAGWMWSGS